MLYHNLWHVKKSKQFLSKSLLFVYWLKIWIWLAYLKCNKLFVFTILVVYIPNILVQNNLIYWWRMYYVTVAFCVQIRQNIHWWQMTFCIQHINHTNMYERCLSNNPIFSFFSRPDVIEQFILYLQFLFQ